MTEETVGIVEALRRRWWLVAGAPFLTAVLALAFVFWVQPLFEAETRIRFVESAGPLGGAMSSAAASGAGGLSLLASLTGQGVPIQTEMTVLSSRTLADMLRGEVGLGLEISEPARRLRRRIFSQVYLGDQATPGDYRLTPVGDGSFRVAGDLLVDTDPFKPIMKETRSSEDLGVVEPGGTLPVADTRIVLAAEASDLSLIEFTIHPRMDVLEEIQDLVVVTRPERDADVVEIAVRWPDPEVAAEAANLLVDTFIERRDALEAEEVGETAAFLADEVASLQTQLRDAEDSLEAYREAEGVIAPEAQATAAVEQLAEIQARRDILQADGRALRVLLTEIDSLVAAEGGVALGPLEESPYRRLVYFPTLLESTATAELVRLMGELENERALLLDRRLPEAAEVRTLTQRIRDLEGQLRTVAETFLDGLGNQVTSLDQTLASFEEVLERVPATETEYLRLRRDVEVLTQVLVFLQTRQKEAELAAAGGGGGVRIVDRALVPREPVRPKPALSMALALAVGAIVGVGGALLLGHADRLDAAA